MNINQVTVLGEHALKGLVTNHSIKDFGGLKISAKNTSKTSFFKLSESYT